MREPRVCIKCGGKESDLIPFYKQGNICARCRTDYGIKRHTKKRTEEKKQEEIASQPISVDGVQLPGSHSVEITRYNAIHTLSDKAKKEARGRVVEALLAHFNDIDKSAVTQRDIEKAVQHIASTGQNQSVTNWYMVILRVSRSDQAAFRWKALFRDWKRRIAESEVTQ